MKPAVLSTALLLAACSLDGSMSADGGRVPSGEWGGEHVRMTVNDSGGSVEFDCGHGALDAALTLDEQGRFDVKGSYVREGGPSRGDEQKAPARYLGTSDGKTLQLTLELSDGTRSGPFSLTLGKSVRLTKCL